uniref:PdxS/SNZ N-terminal domain-containing protein n=1 Tax=Daucus carota subsp. sativus TaxID=79200 RepID=A0A166H9Y8_DAUCS
MADDENAVTIYTTTAITDANKNSSLSMKCVVVVESVESGISRMPDPGLLKEVKRAISIPVMAKARVGHFVEGQILEAVEADYIDESEVIGIADEDHFINKHNFRVPFVCGCKDLGEALRRVREGAAMIRTQGDGMKLGDVVETVGSVRRVMGDIRILSNMDDDEVFTFSKRIGAPYDIVMQTKQMGRLPVVHFACGGIVMPADAALMMQLGCDGVFVGLEVFGCGDPYKKVRAIVQAVRNHSDPRVLAEVSSGFNEGTASFNVNENSVEQFDASRTY